MPHIFIWRPICSTWCWNECVALTTIRIPGNFVLVSWLSWLSLRVLQVSGEAAPALEFFLSSKPPTQIISDWWCFTTVEKQKHRTKRTNCSISSGPICWTIQSIWFSQVCCQSWSKKTRDPMSFININHYLAHCINAYAVIYVWNCMNTVCFTVIMHMLYTMIYSWSTLEWWDLFFKAATSPLQLSGCSPNLRYAVCFVAA